MKWGNVIHFLVSKSKPSEGNILVVKYICYFKLKYINIIYITKANFSDFSQKF